MSAFGFKVRTRNEDECQTPFCGFQTLLKSIQFPSQMLKGVVMVTVTEYLNAGPAHPQKRGTLSKIGDPVYTSYREVQPCEQRKAIKLVSLRPHLGISP